MLTRTAAAALIVVCFVASAWALPVEDVAALDRLKGMNVPVLAKFQEIELFKVFDALASAAPFSVSFEGDVGSQPIAVDQEKQSLKNLLIHLAETYSLSYAVTKDGKLVVRRRAGTG